MLQEHLASRYSGVPNRPLDVVSSGDFASISPEDTGAAERNLLVYGHFADLEDVT